MSQQVLDANFKPQSRLEGLLIEDFGNEMLIYDFVAKKAHGLNREARLIWVACTGANTQSEISELTGLSPDWVQEGIRQLNQAKLLI